MEQHKEKSNEQKQEESQGGIGGFTLIFIIVAIVGLLCFLVKIFF